MAQSNADSQGVSLGSPGLPGEGGAASPTVPASEPVSISPRRSLSLLERDLARLERAQLLGVARTAGVDAARHSYRRVPVAGVAPLDWARGRPRASIVALGLEVLAILGRAHDLGLVAGGVHEGTFRVEGDRPVLVDLARLGEEGERVEPGASRAPEALAGAAVDRRTDVHGAGLLVRSLLEVASPPVLELGSPLDLALATLAAPSRTDRPASAGLARALLASAAGLSLDEIPRPALTPTAVRFTGRSGRLGEALEAARRAFASPPESAAPGLVLVAAPPGGGRTRFADEVLERLARDGVTVVRVSALRTAGRPFGAFVDAILALPRPRAGWPERVREALARVVPELAPAPPAAASPEAVERPVAPESPEEAHDARIVLVDALASALAHLAAGSPLALAIDDLDRADEGSRLAAGFLARRLAAARRFGSTSSFVTGDEGSTEGEVAPPLFFLATVMARWPEPGDGGTAPPGLSEPPDVAALAREAHVLQLALEPLGEEELAALGGALTGEPPSDPKTRELARLSHGSPGLLVEAVRLGNAPSSVPEARRAAAEELAPDDRRILLALVALGSEGDPALLAEVAGTTIGAASESLVRLASRELVRRAPAGYLARPSVALALAADARAHAPDVARALGARVAAHSRGSRPEGLGAAEGELVRGALSIQAAEAASTAGLRDLLDRAAPEAISVLELLRQDGRAARLALARAESSLARGEKATGALWLAYAGRAYFRAGERANANDVLVRATTEGEGLDAELRCNVWRWLGSVRASLGQNDTARAAFRKARATLAGLQTRAQREATPGSASGALERASVFLADAEASFAQGDLDLASERGESGLKVLREDATHAAVPGAARVRARLLGLVGMIALRRGHPGEAETLLRAALALDERHHAESEAARTLQRLGSVALAQGDARAAVGHWRRSLAIRERTGDRSGVAQLQASLSLAIAREGDLAQARSLLRRSLRTREELGDRRGRAAALHNLGYVLAAQGETGAAVRALEECLALREELADLWYLASTRNSLGQVNLDLGRVAVARDHLDVALDLRRRLKDRPGEAATLANLCEIAVRSGDFAEAIELESAARKIRALLGSPEDAIDGLRRGARLEIALGNTSVAVEAAKRAHKLAQQSGLRLQEPPSRLLLGEALARAGKLETAKRELERARAGAEQIGDCLTSRRAEVELGALLVARGFPEDARALLDSVPVPRPGAARGLAFAVLSRRPEAQGPLRVRERLLRARIELARPGGQAALARHFALEALDAARAGQERDLEWRALQAASAAAEREGDENAAVELAAAAQEVVEALLARVPDARRDAWLRADPARSAALRGDTALASLPAAPSVGFGDDHPRIELRRGALEDDDAPTRPGIFTPKKKRPTANKRARTQFLARDAVPDPPRRAVPAAPAPVEPVSSAPRSTPTPWPGPRPRAPESGDVARADFAAILGLNRRIVDEQRVERLFPHLVDSVARLCGAERGFLIFFGESESDVDVLAARGLTPVEVLSARESFARSVARGVAESGEPFVTKGALRESGLVRAATAGADLRSVLAAPVRSPDGRRGALYLDHTSQVGVFGGRELKLAEAIADQCALACGRAALERAVQRARGAEPIEVPREPTPREARSPSRPTVEPARFFGLVGRSGSLRRAIARLAEAARNDDPILVFGPHGVGKERAARALHLAGTRSQRPVVVLDVRDAREPSDIERALRGSDELPGGALERVGSGTLVVKAIDSGTPEVQEALGRVLVDLAAARKTGAPRLVATATSEEAIVGPLAALFSKVRVFLPSLRERREDVLAIAEEVLLHLASESGEPKGLAAPAREALASRPLHGEAREVVATLVAAWARAGARREIEVGDLPPPHPKPGRRRVGVD